MREAQEKENVCKKKKKKAEEPCENRKKLLKNMFHQKMYILLVNDEVASYCI